MSDFVYWLRVYPPKHTDIIRRTPRCPEAEFLKGEYVGVTASSKFSMTRRLRLPKERIGVVVAVIPPGFPPEHALHDAARMPRLKPEQLRIPPGRVVKYIVAFQGDCHVYFIRERQMNHLNGERRKIRVRWAKTEEERRRLHAITPSRLYPWLWW